MTNAQLYLAIGVPLLFNGAITAVLIWFLTGMRDDVRELRTDVKTLSADVHELIGAKR